MAYEWVAPVAGAATGIAGILLSWATNKRSSEIQLKLATSQQDHERSAELRREKRDVYTAFLDRLGKYDRIVAAQGKISRRLLREGQQALSSTDEAASAPIDGKPSTALKRALGALDGEKQAEFWGVYKALDEAFDDVDELLQPVLLTGPRAVREAAAILREDLLDSMLEASWGDWRYVKADLRLATLAAMRVDLGYDEPEDDISDLSVPPEPPALPEPSSSEPRE